MKTGNQQQILGVNKKVLMAAVEQRNQEQAREP